MSAEGNYIVESDVPNWPDSVSQTGTFVATDVSVANNTLVVDINVPTGSLIRLTSNGTLPAPLVYGTAYYAINVNATTIKVATSPVNAAAGTAVDITGTGSVGATHTISVGEGSSESDRQEIIDRVESLIESITKDYYYAKTFSVYLDGNGKSRLFLGFTAKILSITKIEISGIELPSSYYTNDDWSVYRDPDAADDLAEYHLMIKYEDVLFPTGKGNILVTGTIGHATCPPAIKHAAIILCRNINDSTLYQNYSPEYTREKIAEDYDNEKTTRFITGVVEADTILMPYIKKKVNFRAL